MTWGEFRKLTSDIYDEEEMCFMLDSHPICVNKDEIQKSLKEDNVIIFEWSVSSVKQQPEERWAGTLFEM